MATKLVREINTVRTASVFSKLKSKFKNATKGALIAVWSVERVSKWIKDTTKELRERTERAKKMNKDMARPYVDVKKVELASLKDEMAAAKKNEALKKAMSSAEGKQKEAIKEKIKTLKVQLSKARDRAFKNIQRLEEAYAKAAKAS